LWQKLIWENVGLFNLNIYDKTSKIYDIKYNLFHYNWCEMDVSQINYLPYFIQNVSYENPILTDNIDE